MDLWDIATGLMEVAYFLDDYANKIKDMFWFQKSVMPLMLSQNASAQSAGFSGCKVRVGQKSEKYYNSFLFGIK